LPSGTIVEPLAGQVKVAGSRHPGFFGRGRALSRYLRHPKVAVAVSLVGPLDVYVLGNVKTPGKYQLQPDSRLMDALAAAGGLGPVDGDLPAARISEGDKVNGFLSSVCFTKAI
jgi:polysaccharide export outer membrane protein